MGKTSNKICHIVKLRQLMKRWRKNASSSSSNRISPSGTKIPSDVPPGHVAIVVGRSRQRFVVRAKYLNHPIFKNLLAQTEEEYGFHGNGPLAVPCEESVFEEMLRVVTAKASSMALGMGNFEHPSGFSHIGFELKRDCGSDSQPLLGVGGFEEVFCQATR